MSKQEIISAYFATIGSRGGKASGKCKARSSAQARRAVKARWARAKLYAKNFSVEELREHYKALVSEDCAQLTRKQLIKALRGTQFDEFAFD